jgi:hypothetical protein
MGYKTSDIPEDLNFLHDMDDMATLLEAAHGRDLLPTYVSNKLSWPGIGYIGGVRVRKFFCNHEIKPRFRVNLTRGL